MNPYDENNESDDDLAMPADEDVLVDLKTMQKKD